MEKKKVETKTTTSNKYKKLVSNSIIFAIGNFGSKIITILLVPLYTFFLSSSEYGKTDLVITTIGLCLPVISLNIYDSVLRFTMEKSNDKKTILTNSLLIFFISVLISIFLYPILKALNVFDDLLPFFLMILILQEVQQILSQYVRANGKVKIYAYNGIILTLVTAICNVFFLVFLHLGISGYFYSLVIANCISVIHLIKHCDLASSVSINNVSFPMLRTMIKYSMPLIPNAIMWWLINGSTRYFIFYFLGSVSNGLFAVASKIPAMLSVITSIFFQAWQLSAIEEFESGEKSEFYSNIFSWYTQLLFLSASLILLFLRPLMSFVVEHSYYESWKIVPFLLLSVIYSSFATFLGTNYIAAKKTKGVFTSSVFSALISVFLNMVLIPIIGVVGAAIASLISFFTMWFFRIFDTQKFIKVHLNLKNIILNNLVFLGQTFFLYVSEGFLMILSQLILFIICVIINREILNFMISLFRRKFH